MNYRSTRDGEDMTTPVSLIQGPKAMIINEYAGSGGDAMPWHFRQAKIGVLVLKQAKILSPHCIYLLVDDDVSSLLCPGRAVAVGPRFVLLMIHSPSCSTALDANADRSIHTPTSRQRASTP
jgi:hypothetical protein